MRTLDRVRLLRSLFRLNERLTTLRTADRHARTSDGLPLPPPYLRTLTAGTADSRWFLESGRASAKLISAALARHGVQIDSVERVLDFGCGCGRILRHWQHFPRTEVHAAEPNARLAEWCVRNLAFAVVLRSSPVPPLGYAAGNFDFIYAVSVFTHLAEEAQEPWLQELRRILRTDGLLLISLHGDLYRDRLSSAERRAYDDGALVVRRPEASGTNLCTAFHPGAYVRDQFTLGFELLEHESGGFERGAPEQDLVLLRRSGPNHGTSPFPAA